MEPCAVKWKLPRLPLESPFPLELGSLRGWRNFGHSPAIYTRLCPEPDPGGLEFEIGLRIPGWSDVGGFVGARYLIKSLSIAWSRYRCPKSRHKLELSNFLTVRW